MSHEKVSKIRITHDKVFITSASNNVFPRHYYEWECTPLSQVLINKGIEAVELAIFADYEQYNFQAGSKNKYYNWLKKLEESEDYDLINWRKSNYEENCPIQKNRRSQLYFDILKKYMPKSKGQPISPMINAIEKFAKTYTQLNLF